MHSAYYAVARCLSGSQSHAVETAQIFLPSGSHNVLVFPYHTLWRYAEGDALTWASNAGGVWKNGDFWPVSRFISDMVRDRAIVAMERQ